MISHRAANIAGAQSLYAGKLETGQPVIVPTPQTTQDADARMAEGRDTVDWYFTTKTL